MGERLKWESRERVAEILDEWKWERLFEESGNLGVFKKLSREAEKALAKGEVSATNLKKY